MRTLQLIASMVLVAPALCFGQQINPFTPDSLTRGLWHFDESSGTTLHDSSGAGNSGIATGTGIVAGRFGNARSFNGVGDYITVPSNRAFDFDTSSFQIDLWFKTSDQAGAMLLRRGIAPVPGYLIAMDGGRLRGTIGNREDSSWPDTLISVWSDGRYNDNQWHLVTMVRNRSLRKLILYVDGILAGPPSEDQCIIPLNNDRPLTIARWENYDYPSFFKGAVDEVRLWSPKLISVIHVQPTLLDFGNVKVGSSDTLLLSVSNSGFRDALRISSVTSGNPRFDAPSGPLFIPAGESINIPIWYTPLASMRDTGFVTITSNDPILPFLEIRVRGKGLVFTAEPIIDKVTLVPFTYYQLRVRWFRSTYDSTGVIDPVTEYSIWRSVPGAAPSNGWSLPDLRGLPSSALTVTVWEFITTVPALRFDAYSCLVPAVVDYTYNYTSNVLLVAARTKNLLVFLSLPDTVQLNPGFVTGIGQTESRQTVNEFRLSQNYPNPFNPTTKILYDLPRTSHVTLAVYDLLGREVATLVNGVEGPGYKSVEFNATDLAGGMFFYRITAGDHVQTKKMLLLK